MSDLPNAGDPAGTNPGEVLARLQECLRQAEHPACRAGRTAGKAWADRSATPAELARLEAWHDQLATARPDGWPWFFFDRESRRDQLASVAAELVWALHPEVTPTIGPVKAFWASVGGGDSTLGLSVKHDTDDKRLFIKAFAEAGLHVWDGLKGQMKPL